jgi:hypothetical protein
MTLDSNGLTLGCDRRTFLKSTAVLAGLTLWPVGSFGSAAAGFNLAPRKKKPALIRGAFFYPPADLVLAGKNEDGWSKHEWFTWPGNQFAPEQQQTKFLAQLRRLTSGLELSLALEEKPIYTDAGIRAFIASLENSKPDALLLFNFWNSFSAEHGPSWTPGKGRSSFIIPSAPTIRRRPNTSAPRRACNTSTPSRTGTRWSAACVPSTR